MRWSFLISVPFLLLGSAQGADDGGKMTCADSGRRWTARGERSCEIRESTITAVPNLTILTGNGGITVRGWNQKACLIRAKVQTWSRSKKEARAVSEQIQVMTDGGTITARTPPTLRDQGFAITYEVFIPYKTDVTLKSGNGGMVVAGIQGRVIFETGNGGVVLSQVGGRVQGTASNGGLRIELTGSRWEGEGLEVTASGTILLELPSDYSARLELATAGGRIHSAIPAPGYLENQRKVSMVLGDGGPVLRAFSRAGISAAQKCESKANLN